jgi:TRAP-type mannitol/chloroaromatic compound transport system permease large subunit
MGLISLPSMLKNNYSQPLATGTIAASGTLGQIIPPSIVLIILADQLASATDQASTARKALYKESTGEITMPADFGVTSTSAGEMFLGALVPGLVLVALYMIFILGYAFIKPSVAPPIRREGVLDRAFFFRLFIVLVPPLALIFMVLGSILTGVATVNQAGAIGAAGALLMASYRLAEGKRGTYLPALLALASIAVIAYVVTNFNTNIKSSLLPEDQRAVHIAIGASATLVLALVWSAIRTYKIDDTLREVMIETAKATSLVFIILLGAAMLTAAFRAFGGEELVRHFLESLPGGFWAKFVTVMIVIFILGFFLDFIEIAVVVVPIVAPILLADPSANITAVWLGVMIGLNIQTSFLTPPFGFALFYLRGVAPKVVRTVNMYKGVIPFIALQLLALFIVAKFPPLVNYLPNRVSFLSETAPPPRNPKLQQCLENYVVERLDSGDVPLQSLLDTARSVDVTTLPEELRNDFLASLDSGDEAIAKLREAGEAAEAVAAASDAYRPAHGQVRDLEATMRDIETTIKELETTRSRIRGEDREARRKPFDDQIAELELQLEEISSNIPTEWAETYSTFNELIRAENTARTQYRRAADQSYRGVGEVGQALASTDQLQGAREELRELQSRISSGDTEFAVAELSVLRESIEELPRIDDLLRGIASAINALEGDDGADEVVMDVSAAVAAIDEGLAGSADELGWRQEINANTADAIVALEVGLRDTLGIRTQRRMTREQALYVASCNSGHTDVSLNF